MAATTAKVRQDGQTNSFFFAVPPGTLASNWRFLPTRYDQREG
jgi:hypothetical protein